MKLLSVYPPKVVPDDSTFYLVGPEGLVWSQPTIGEPFILAARNERERENAAAFVGELLRMGLVPYGLPLARRVEVALLGVSPLQDGKWVLWRDAPAPVGDDDLPTETRVFDTWRDRRDKKRP